ncbi:MAG: SHOCT domain-containing protein [Candidatus Eisenbacteria bacterium]|uniref:SHOCT domain-containing protein n=1 Tax=Eiseniibacteriota bacterium TaxID=2212470 RepID=A0A956SDE1_UNCEI|nr:SHOCT domain-containing protein [Candidatus Eisenbacteria bacterium]
MYGHMGGFMGGGFMWILWIVLAAALVFGIVRLTNHGGSGSSNDHDESPEEILKRRYARGEIGQDQYERTLSQLRR